MAEVYAEISGLVSKPNHHPVVRPIHDGPFVVALDLEVADGLNTSADGNSIIEVLLTRKDINQIIQVAKEE